MIRQYFAQRSKGGDNPLRVGTIAIGSIYYLQDDGWWRDRFRGAPLCRNPWIVEAYLNGILGAARRDPATGHWMSLYIAGRSDMALVRSLRDGRRRHVAVHLLQAHDDEAICCEPTAYPDLPSAAAIERYHRARAEVRPATFRQTKLRPGK
jgi:hypothetical protein